MSRASEFHSDLNSFRKRWPDCAIFAMTPDQFQMGWGSPEAVGMAALVGLHNPLLSDEELAEYEASSDPGADTYGS